MAKLHIKKGDTVSVLAGDDKGPWNIFKDQSHKGHKTNLNKFKSTEIISSNFSDHN